MSATQKGPRLRILLASTDTPVNQLAQHALRRLSSLAHVKLHTIWDSSVPAGSTPPTSEVIYLNPKSSGPFDWYEDVEAECKWADLLVFAPMGADTLAKMLHGIVDDFLLGV